MFSVPIPFHLHTVNIIYTTIEWTSENNSGPVAVSSPWLPMLRMIRVVRTLRIARILSGIRTLLFALMLSAPALFNVGSLLFLFIYIYAILGMSQFSNVEKKGAINEVLNFESFPSTFLILFQVCSAAALMGELSLLQFYYFFPTAVPDEPLQVV